MPTLSTLQAFADTVESNDHVGAIQKFYAPDASTRENDQPPMVGRDALAEKERFVLASVASVKTTRLGPPLLDGDHSAIRWRFEFTAKDGSKRVIFCPPYYRSAEAHRVGAVAVAGLGLRAHPYEGWL